MGKHLSEQQVTAIVGSLDGWAAGTSLTWSALVARAAKRLGVRVARQTLARHEPIKLGFQLRKAGLRREAGARGDDRPLEQRLRRVMTEKARLLAENGRYREKLVRWQYNAYKSGLRERDLEEPLPEVDRKRST